MDKYTDNINTLLKLIDNTKYLFEMTKFHKRLIYLLKSLIITLSLYYLHIHCKVKLKGKMQYKKRTKTVILFKQSILTNTTNEVEIKKEFIKPDIFLFTKDFIGIPIYTSIHKNHISFEHTHPPHEYILSGDKFKKISELKLEINAIIN